MKKDLFLFKLKVTLFWSSIGYGIHSVYKLEPGLGLCHFNNLVVDLLEEAPYLFSAQVKADSDSGVDWVDKKSYMGETISKFWLFVSVGETD